MSLGTLMDRWDGLGVELELDMFEDCIRIKWICVAQEDRFKGIGRRCIQEIQEYASQIKKNLVLFTSPKNPTVEIFYKKLGFTFLNGRKMIWEFSIKD